MSDFQKIRTAILLVFVGLVLSGVTAFPLLHELNIMASVMTGGSDSLNPEHYTGITKWILKVREGLETTYESYPFIAYGTDWLAFAHLMIALFFILPYRDPVRYLGVLQVGIWCSLLIFPLALICGHLREIPIFWRLIDCSFGAFCIPPLLYAIKLTKGLPAYERGS
ncbi:MAG: hypothetical protein ACJAQT_002103 [Akkermansiaceae bacterium]|jgi:hypothetical protein